MVRVNSCSMLVKDAAVITRGLRQPEYACALSSTKVGKSQGMQTIVRTRQRRRWKLRLQIREDGTTMYLNTRCDEQPKKIARRRADAVNQTSLRDRHPAAVQFGARLSRAKSSLSA